MSTLALTPAASGRDIRFDALRGLMLLCMTSNHLPTDLRILTDEGPGIISSAEGFVFLSGLLAGLVYGRRLIRDGAGYLRTTVWRRAGTIYRWHLVTYFAAFVLLALDAWISGTHSVTSPPLFASKPLLAAALGPVMLYQPGLLDILPMYCVFVLLLPPVLGALEKGRSWLVLGLSFAVWALVQFLPNYDGSIIAPPLNFGFFNLLAWQFLFVSGIVIGHAKMKGTAPLAPLRPGLLATAGAGAVFFFCLSHRFIPSLWPDRNFGIMLNKPSLGALRLMSFALVAYLVAVAGARFPRLLAWRPLAMLGRHSLFVVSVQCVLVLLLLAHDSLFATPARSWAVTGAALAILFVATAAYEKWSRKMADPAVVYHAGPLSPFAAVKTQEQARAA